MGTREPIPSIIGIATYRPEDWGRLRRVAADSEELESTWTEWNQTITKVERQLWAAGVVFETVLVDLDQLARFCEERGLDNDSDARSRFVAEVLRRRHEGRVDNPPQRPGNAAR